MIWWYHKFNSSSCFNVLQFVLKIAPANMVSRRNVSGGAQIIRPLSTARQEYGTNKKNWPLSEPVIKLEALAQTSGIDSRILLYHWVRISKQNSSCALHSTVYKMKKNLILFQISYHS